MMQAKNMLFRADSSSAIGTGHIMRNLVLAEKFKDANIIFATQDLPGNINHKIKEKEYMIEILNYNDSKYLEEAYQDAEQFYWTRVDQTSDEIMFGKDSIPIIIPRHLVQDIDTYEGWKRTEIMYKVMVELK